MRFARLMLGLLPPLAAITQVLAADGASLMAPLKDQGFVRGCAWSAKAESLGDRFIFLAELDDSLVRMNIADVDTDLKLASRSGKAEKRGDILKKIYRAEGIEVRATFKVTWDCSMSASESCEATWYDATFEVETGGALQTIQATGGFGC